MDWFQQNRDLRHERIKELYKKSNDHFLSLSTLYKPFYKYNS